MMHRQKYANSFMKIGSKKHVFASLSIDKYIWLL